MSGPALSLAAATAARSDWQSVPAHVAPTASPDCTTVNVAARAAGAIAKVATTSTSTIRVHRIDIPGLLADEGNLLALGVPCSSV